MGTTLKWVGTAIVVGAVALGSYWAYWFFIIKDRPIGYNTTPYENLEAWRWYSQGSRLMPRTWFDALEVADSETRFASLEHLTSFGYLTAPNAPDRDYPIGFAIDLQNDNILNKTKLRWYEGQTGGSKDSEPWIGLNCAACHTGTVTYNGVTTIIEGGPTMSDFQGFVYSFYDAVEATRNNPEKWDRFASRVLASTDNPEDDALLRDAYDKFANYQIQIERINQSDTAYGFGRLDAFGHIFNKMILFSNEPPYKGNPSNAPVSYPFLWGIDDQYRVQWTGAVKNGRIKLRDGAYLDVGALGRNSGEVLGVFGDITIDEQSNIIDNLIGYKSSINVRNLVAFERYAGTLQPPPWPEHFPAPDAELVKKGGPLFEENCSRCHGGVKPKKDINGREKMISLQEMQDDGGMTDPTTACNVATYKGFAGTFAGMKSGYFRKNLDDDDAPEKLGLIEDVGDMVTVAVTGALFAEKKAIGKQVVATFFGVELPAQDIPTSIEPQSNDPLRQVVLTNNFPARDRCNNRGLLSQIEYKAHPLEGIWATAPYLHNGSVRSLAELLLLPEDRSPGFNVGAVEFDPKNVGLSDTVLNEELVSFLQTRNALGNPIPGNSNQGHLYGTGLDPDEKAAIVEYLKTQ